jgi:transposase
MPLNMSNFKLPQSEASKLREIDSLVDVGLSRVRAEWLVNKLYAVIDGPWADTLASLEKPTQDVEATMLQTFFIAYVHQWASERLLKAAAAQDVALLHLVAKDLHAPKKEF